MKREQEAKPGWELHTGMFEIHWKRQSKDKLYADKVRIRGVLFFAAVHGDLPVRRLPAKRKGKR